MGAAATFAASIVLNSVALAGKKPLPAAKTKPVISKTASTCTGCSGNGCCGGGCTGGCCAGGCCGGSYSE